MKLSTVISTCICILFASQVLGQVTEKWSGTVSFSQKTTGPYVNINEKKIDVTILNSIVQDSIVYKADHSFYNAAGTVISRKNCDGRGRGELHAVDISGGEYYVHIVTHTYNCASVSNEGTENFTEQSDITFSGHFFNNNFNVLSGSDTTKVPTGDGDGMVTSVTTWNLVRGPLDVELIVTPANYNVWMPEPGENDFKKGNTMEIGLKIQKRNGQPSSFKVQSFQLLLSNTSIEKGITINMPVEPSGIQLPDLRFIPHPSAESNQGDQAIEVSSEDGVTGKSFIASYDGGGWTTLSVIAKLEGGLEIEGKLFNPTGTTQIPIPKRDPGSKIAKAWVTANGNPADTDDKEILPLKPGDGLSAYEEYRGVICYTGTGALLNRPKFMRLSPLKAEIGIQFKKDLYRFFAEGIQWFHNASGLKPVLFSENEIPDDRRLNKNQGYANVYEQYVLKIDTGATSKNASGENRPVHLDFMIPRQSELIVINVRWIKEFYSEQQAAAIEDHLIVPYTENEMLAQTVAHEIGHGVNINHHGKPSITPQNRIAYEDNNPQFHIFSPPPNSREIPVSQWRLDPVLNKRFYPLRGVTGMAQNEESGDLSCLMAYTSNYQWAFRISNQDASLYYYRVPLLPLGKNLCTSKQGTGINSRTLLGINNVNRFFGDAGAASDQGNCNGQIKLRD